MGRWLTGFAVLTALAVSLCGSAFGGEVAPGFSAYLAELGNDDFASAIVYLNDRPNIRALDAELRVAASPMSVRHERVLTTLHEAAARSQPALLDYLSARAMDGSVRGYTPYWIMNLVVVSATKAELLRIAERGDVEAVEGNFCTTLIESAEDAYTGDPVAGIGVTNSLFAINADRVWRELGITGAGTLVANLDTGVDGNHPALAARWRGNSHPWQECWRDALGTGTHFPTDGHGHGTHTMGTICGAGHASGDTVGVAFDATWIADNSINQGVGPEFDNDVLGAFQWFADPDGNPSTTDDVPDVLQNSWGIDARFGYDYQDCDYRWQEAIENCEAAGIVVTFSSGNEGPSAQTHRSPANVCNTPTVNFAVGAVDCENYGWPYPIASFSSRGPSDCDGVTIKPEVCGPGVSVYSSYPGGSYVRMSGTSMAGPHVAGVVALMRQANPNADVQTIKSVLMSTARDLGTAGEDNSYGWGIIDAYEAVLAVMVEDTTPPEVTVTTPNGGEVLSVSGVYTITWNATDNIGVTHTDLFYSYDGGSAYNLIAGLSGNPGSYNWAVPNTPSTQCLVMVEAYDQAGNHGSDVSNGYFTIEATPVPYVWVDYINLEIVTKGNRSYAGADLRVLDQNGDPVSGAVIYSHWDGLTQDSDVFTTKRQGTGSCKSDRIQNANGCWYYYVDDVTATGFVFRSDLGETYDQTCTAGGGAAGDEAGTEMSVLVHPRDSAGGTSEFLLSLPHEASVTFTIYDVSGQQVKTLVNRTLPAGSHNLTWDGTNMRGEVVANGIYLYQVISGDDMLTDKMLLLR
jgi:subtilisin family serine protease